MRKLIVIRMAAEITIAWTARKLSLYEGLVTCKSVKNNFGSLSDPNADLMPIRSF